MMVKIIGIRRILPRSALKIFPSAGAALRIKHKKIMEDTMMNRRMKHTNLLLSTAMPVLLGLTGHAAMAQSISVPDISQISDKPITVAFLMPENSSPRYEQVDRPEFTKMVAVADPDAKLIVSNANASPIRSSTRRNRPSPTAPTCWSSIRWTARPVRRS
jgi:hypothetical protein